MKDKNKLIITMILLSSCISIFTGIYIFGIREIASRNLAQNTSEFYEGGALEETNLTIKIEIDNPDNLVSKKIKLVSDTYTKEEIVLSDTIIFKNTPVGKYKIILPSSKENIYNYSKENEFELSKENNEVIYKYEQDNSNLAHDEVINFKNDDGVYATVFFDRENIIIKKTNVALASSFIKIYDENDNLLKEYDFMDDTLGDTFEDSYPYKSGYKIAVYHVGGASDLAITSGLFSSLSIKSGINNFIIGSYGLYQEGLDEYQSYIDKLDSYASSMIYNTSLEEYNNKELYEKEKRTFYLSILTLPEDLRQSYLNKYSVLFKGSKPILNDEEVNLENFEDIYTTIEGTDLEDGAFALNENNFKVFVDANTLIAGENTINYALTDTDGNTEYSSLKINLNNKVEETKKEDEPKVEVPKEEIKDDTPVSFEYKGEVIVIESEADETDVAYGGIISLNHSDNKEEPNEKEIKEEKKNEKEDNTSESQILLAKEKIKEYNSLSSFKMMLFLVPIAIVISLIITTLIKYFKKQK